MGEEQRIKELEEKVHKLEEELTHLSAKIEKIETATKFKGDSKTSAARLVPQMAEPKPTKAVEREVEPEYSYVEPEKTDWEKLILQTWLPRLFIFVFIIGVLWGLRAASDYGYLNDTVKIGLGYLTAIALYFIGERQISQKREVLGQVLVGGSIAVFIMTTFAMHSIYAMTGPILAFILLVAGIMLGGWLTIRYHSQGLGVLSVVGGFLVPFLVESAEPSTVFFVGYETLLFLVFLTLAMRKQFAYLYATAFGLLQVTLFLFYAFTPTTSNDFLLAAGIVVQHACVLFFYLTQKSFWKLQASILFISALFTYSWVNGIWQEGFVSVFLLSGIILYGVLAYYFVKSEKLHVLATNCLLFIFLFIFHAINEDFAGALLLVQGVAAFYLASRIKSYLNKIVAVFIYSIGVAHVLFDPIGTVVSTETLEWLILLSTFVIGTYIIWREGNSKSALLTASSLIFTFLSLIFVSQLTWRATLFQPYEVQTVWISVSWITLAILAIGLGLWKSFNQAKYIGVGLLVLTLIKLILLDFPFIPIPFRAFLFILLGVIGLIASRIFYKKK